MTRAQGHGETERRPAIGRYPPWNGETALPRAMRSAYPAIVTDSRRTAWSRAGGIPRFQSPRASTLLFSLSPVLLPALFLLKVVLYRFEVQDVHRWIIQYTAGYSILIDIVLRINGTYVRRYAAAAAVRVVIFNSSYRT